MAKVPSLSAHSHSWRLTLSVRPGVLHNSAAVLRTKTWQSTALALLVIPLYLNPQWLSALVFVQPSTSVRYRLAGPEKVTHAESVLQQGHRCPAVLKVSRRDFQKQKLQKRGLSLKRNYTSHCFR